MATITILSHKVKPATPGLHASLGSVTNQILRNTM